MNELGPEMTADGWSRIGDDGPWDYGTYFWMHPPSSRVVSISVCLRREWHGPTWHEEPASQEADGYAVTCRVHDELGNPISGKGFWIESFGRAVKLGREIRRHILGERPPVTRGEQLTFDEVLERQTGERP